MLETLLGPPASDAEAVERARSRWRGVRRLLAALDAMDIDEAAVSIDKSSIDCAGDAMEAAAAAAVD